jgi:hypothetical protein
MIKILIIILSFMLLNINSNLFAGNTVAPNQRIIKAIDLSKYKDHTLLYSAIKQLKHGDISGKINACTMLTNLGNRRAIQPLLAFILSLDLSPKANNVAYSATKAIVMLRNQKANAKIEKIFKKNPKPLQYFRSKIVTTPGYSEQEKKMQLDRILTKPPKNTSYLIVDYLKTVKSKHNKVYLLKLLATTTDKDIYTLLNLHELLDQYLNDKELVALIDNDKYIDYIVGMAFYTLATRGKSEKNKKILLEVLTPIKGKDKYPPTMVIKYLTNFHGDKDVQKYLLRLLKYDEDSIIEALGEFGGTDAIMALEKHYSTSKNKVEVLSALNKLGAKSFVSKEANILAKKLLKKLKDNSNIAIAIESLETIEKLWKFANVDSSVMPFLTNYLLTNFNAANYKNCELFEGVDETEVCSLILKAMTKSKTPLTPELKNFLMNAENESLNYDKNARLALLLYHCDDKEANKLCQPIYENVVKDKFDFAFSPYFSIELISALALHKGKIIDGILISILQDSDKPENRILAAKALAGRKSKAVRKALEYAEKYEAYPNVRKAITKTLQSLKSTNQ